VRLEADVVRLIATETIPVGQVIRAEQVKEEVYRGFPSKEATLRADEVAGKIALRPIRALSVIRPEQLSVPYTIRRGATAIADYRDGAIHLRVPVVAEQDGHVGDRIRVKSERQRTLYAVVGEGGSLEVTAGAAPGRAYGRSSTK
jgi:flagella basal body P-ring formation protein FlgA